MLGGEVWSWRSGLGGHGDNRDVLLGHTAGLEVWRPPTVKGKTLSSFTGSSDLDDTSQQKRQEVISRVLYLISNIKVVFKIQHPAETTEEWARLRNRFVSLMLLRLVETLI